jgi:hypothetical protein
MCRNQHLGNLRDAPPLNSGMPPAKFKGLILIDINLYSTEPPIIEKRHFVPGSGLLT